jgi:serine-type D-Ala-D-Ala carboxypeptidase
MPGSFHQPRQILLDAVRARVTPCAVAEVGTHAGPIWNEAAGALTYDAAGPATALTVFDLASLTKVVATTALAMRLVDAGRLHLEAPLREYLPRWDAPDRSAVTIIDLLEHAAGLPAVLPLYEAHAGTSAFEQAICDAPLAYPPRTRSVYSDLGFIVLGFVLANVAGRALDEHFTALVDDLALARAPDVLRYRPLDTGVAPAGIAPTRFDDRRGRPLRGEVDDRNGEALGGVAGHTGLFGTAAAVGRFARGMLAGARGDQAAARRPATAETIRRFLMASAVPGSSRALGWDRMRPTSSCGTRMSSEAFGHTGFTGTSLWIDPVADAYVVLLTNRIHPIVGSADGIRALRRRFHDAVMKEVAGPPDGRPAS